VAILAVRGNLPRVPGLAAFAAAVGLGVVALRIGGNDVLYPWGISAAALASTIVVAHLARAERIPLLAHPGLVWCGRISYGLYLWHYPIMFGLRPMLRDVSLWVTIPLLFALSFAAAWASWRIIEWPFLRGSRAGRLRGAASPA
jgi:peptidoglycan/LPS O-acetylase OafA/YrhL